MTILPLYYCYECGHINQTGVYSIVNGSENKELAELYLAWMGYPENAVQVSNYITYGPLHPEAVALAPSVLDPAIVEALPTSPIALEKVIIMDEFWLGTNLKRGPEDDREVPATAAGVIDTSGRRRTLDTKNRNAAEEAHASSAPVR